MKDRLALCTHASPAAHALLLALLIGCGSDRPTFPMWDDSDGGRAKSLDASVALEATTCSDAASSPVTEASATSDARADRNAISATNSHASGNPDDSDEMADVFLRGVDSGQLSTSDASVVRSHVDGGTDGGILSDARTGLTPTLPDSGANAQCDRSVASGVTLEGSSNTLIASLGAPIGDINLVYLPEVQLYAIAFERGLSGSALSLATFDELGNLVSEPAYIGSPLLDESLFDTSPQLAWNGSTLGLFLQGSGPEGEDSMWGLTLALDGSVLSERQWPLDTAPGLGFELAAFGGEFIGFWHLTNDDQTLSVVQRLDTRLQPLDTTWQPLLAEPWSPAVATQGTAIALTRGTREEAQLYFLSGALDPVQVASVDEPNSGTPLVVGTSSGYALAWNRTNQQVRFVRYDSDGTLSCGPVLLSDEPRVLVGLTAMQGGYLTLTMTDDHPKHVEWLAVSEHCVGGPATSITYESVVTPAATSGASTVAIAWVELEQNTYTLKYTVMNNGLCP